MKKDKNTPLLAFDDVLDVTPYVAPTEDEMAAARARTSAAVVEPPPAPAPAPEKKKSTKREKAPKKTRETPATDVRSVTPPCECAIYQSCERCRPPAPVDSAPPVEAATAHSTLVERVDDEDVALVDATPPILDSDAPLQFETDGASSDHFQLTAPPSELYPAQRIIDCAFDYFRKRGFPYRTLPLHVALQELNKLARTEQSALLHTTAAYQVADNYNPHRFHAAAEKMKSPLESFQDDDKLRHAIKLQLEQTGGVPDHYFSTLGIVRGTQSCSNFRPGFACLLYREYCAPGSVVLDTSTGYGGRLVGFMASKIGKRYIGIDPNTLTYAGNTRMAQELGFADVVELHNLPAEDVKHDVVRGRCDFSFTSPPYFAKEHYSEEPTQSWKRYGDSFDAWCKGFLQPMLALTFVALKRDSYALVNIADVTLRGKRWPLVQATVNAAKAVGFAHVCTRMFPLNVRVGANQQTEIPYEPVLVFQKRRD